MKGSIRTRHIQKKARPRPVHRFTFPQEHLHYAGRRPPLALHQGEGRPIMQAQTPRSNVKPRACSVPRPRPGIGRLYPIRSRKRSAFEPSLRLHPVGPCLTPHAEADGDTPLIGKGAHLHLGHALASQDDRGKEIHVLQGHFTLTQGFSPSREHEFGKPRSGQDHPPARLVIGQGGHHRGIDVRIPDPRIHPFLAPQIGMLPQTIAIAVQDARRAVDPDFFRLPRIGRQIVPMPYCTRKHAVAMQLHSGNDSPRQDPCHRVDPRFGRLVLATIQSRQHDAAGTLKTTRHISLQDRRRPDLQKGPDAPLPQRHHGRKKGNRLAHIGRPVICPQGLPRHLLPGHGRNEGNPRRCWPQIAHSLAQRLGHWLECVAVIRVIDRKLHRRPAQHPPHMAQEGIQHLALTHDRNAAWAVLGGQFHPTPESRDSRAHVFSRCLHRQHPARAAQRLRCNAAQMRHHNGLTKRQRTRSTGRRHLTTRMTHDRRRAQPARLIGPELRKLIGEKQRLRDARIAQFPLQITRRQPVNDRPTRQAPEGTVDLAHGRRIGRIMCHRAQTHPGILRPVSGKDEGHISFGQIGTTDDKPMIRFPLRPARQGRRCRRRVVADQRRAMRQTPAICSSLPAQFVQPGFVPRTCFLRDQRLPCRHHARQGPLTCRRQQKHRRITSRAASLFGNGPNRCTLKNSMRIGSAKTEGTHPGKQFPFAQRQRFLRHSQVQPFEIDPGIKRLGMQARRQYPALQRDQRLQHACNARGRFQMADVRLHRSDRQRLRARLTKHPAQGPCLHRITGEGPGPMRLDKCQCGRIDLGPVIDPAQQRGLPIHRRQSHIQGAPVSIHLHCPQNAVRPPRSQIAHGPAL